MPNPFRQKDGRYASGIYLTPEDILSQSIRRGSCRLIPPVIPAHLGYLEGARWRIQASRVRGTEGFFPPNSKPTVRMILYTLRYRSKPAEGV